MKQTIYKTHEAIVFKAKKNWFETLYAALEAEELTEYWDGTPMSYDETLRKQFEIDGRLRTVVIYRNEKGMYERPIHYDAGAIRK